MSTYIRAVVAAKAIADKYGIPLGDLVDTFSDIPAADVAPVRRGRWIEEDGIQICSECGEEHEWEDYRAPYCDTCGAKMNNEGACPYEDIRDFIIADDACRDCVYARPIKKLKYQHSCQYRNGPNCNLN
jgi:hypothetical protein|uniref:Hydrogenase/urease nickel incorporation protein n=1 Tax=Siphoviridae sp. ct91l7 TaxID=2826173 RepID=A0A8S5MXJ7_9CAUD|nr:MAG TPA: hydrogenase/urease nickel incorporation protein [Siphoviridae sp. ct91l7]